MRLAPRVNLVAAADAFCAAHGIDDATVGAHLRMTDTGTDADLDRCVDAIRRLAPGRRVFLCSDDPDAAARVRDAFPDRVVVRAGLAAVTRRDGTRGWLERPATGNPFNVERSRAAVEDGLIDLLILARTRPSIDNGSGFFRVATWLAASRRRAARSRPGRDG
jgi:hypothetical protein